MSVVPDLAPKSEHQSEFKLENHADDFQANLLDEKQQEPVQRPQPVAIINSPPLRPSSTATTLSGTSTPAIPKTPPSTGPPPLPYSLHAHKWTITIIWTLLLIDTAILPLALFYPLWYGTATQPWIIIAITSSIFGVISGAEWCYRTYKLLRNKNLRPVGSRGWWAFDAFHWIYSIGYGIALVRLSLFSIILHHILNLPPSLIRPPYPPSSLISTN